MNPDPLTVDIEYMCPNCVTPWRCNGPHIPEEEAESFEEYANRAILERDAMDRDSVSRRSLYLAIGCGFLLGLGVGIVVRRG